MHGKYGLSLLVAGERPSCDCLLLYRLRFWSCTVEHLEEVGRLGSHPGVDVGLGTLDVVVQVVPKDVDQVYRVVPCLAVCMPGKKHKGDVADAVADTGVCILQLLGGLPVAEEHLWGCVAGLAAFLELLGDQGTGPHEHTEESVLPRRALPPPCCTVHSTLPIEKGEGK